MEAFNTISEDFTRELTKAQFDLKAYIVALLGGPNDAMDVLQETNVALMRKAADYNPSRPFIAWAKAFAHNQVLAFRTRRSRDRVVFDEDLMAQLSETFSAETPADDRDLSVLDDCLAKMTPFQRRYLAAKYTLRLSVEEIAAKFDQTPSAIVSLLYRFRNMLHDCMAASLRPASHGGLR